MSRRNLNLLKMKRQILLLLLCLSVSTWVSAQRIGLKGGLNFANADYSSEGIDITTNALTGVQIGVFADVPFSLSGLVNLNTGLFYTQKGLKMDFMGAEVKIPVNYLEVPVNINYNLEAGPLKAYVQAGPYLGYGLKAKAKAGGEEEDIDFGSGDDEIKQVDFGLNIGAGIEVSKLQLGLNYGLGLTNLENAGDTKMKNRVFSVTVGYYLW